MEHCVLISSQQTSTPAVKAVTWTYFVIFIKQDCWYINKQPMTMCYIHLSVEKDETARTGADVNLVQKFNTADNPCGISAYQLNN